MIAQTSTFSEAANPGNALRAWSCPPSALVLNDDEIHVWRASLDMPPAEVEKFSRMLSVGERARSERSYFQKDRENFVAVHGLLRSILSRYVAGEPHRLQFSFGPHGKPALTDPRGNGSSIRFNISHSHGLMLCAVALDREVGVDVEFVRPRFATQMLTECGSASPELREILALPEEDRTEVFFVCWTRKEAYLKARGEGLAMSLAHDLCSSSAVIDETHGWTCWRLAPGPGHIGALVAGAEDFAPDRKLKVLFLDCIQANVT